MKVSAKYAQEHFQELASAAYNGESVEIESPEKPVLRLVPSPIQPARIDGKRILGAGEGLIRLPSDEEWRAMDEEIADEMLNGPLFPSDRD